MSTTKTKKLQLHRETVRNLDKAALDRARGGVSAVCGASVWWDSCKCGPIFPPTELVMCGVH